ncbi:MAG: LysR family transcriptional regulator [Lachnospiraceae bacterium]|nr:LysR family transcriptional regulator [Lachnospiraceae bacterium]
MDINFELYKVFYYVATTLSFSEASRKLFISQSAVSQSIKVLEKRLNQTLFIRSTKKVRLTKEGELLFKHIEPAVNLILQGENQILVGQSLNGGQLRIGASDTICRYYLVPYLNRFHKQYPDIHIKVTNGTSMQCVEFLENNQVDLIVVNAPNARLNTLSHVTELCAFEDVFVASKEAFAPLLDSPVTLEQLGNQPILMLESHSTTSVFLHHLFLEHQLELAPAVELSSNDLLIDLARIGLGIAFVPKYCVSENDTELSILELTEALPKRRICAAYNEHFSANGAAGIFLNMLSQNNN